MYTQAGTLKLRPMPLMLLLALALLAGRGSPHHVVELSHRNWDSYLDEDLMLLAFVAPWCGHCQALLPELELAAATLSEEQPDVIVAKVDGTEEVSLAKAHGVEGWPTLLWFRAGVFSRFPRLDIASEIVQHVSSKVAPPIVYLKDAGSLHAFIGVLDITVVFFGAEGTERYLAFAAAADGDPASASPHKPFGHVDRPDLFPEGSDPSGSLQMYTRSSTDSERGSQVSRYAGSSRSAADLHQRPFFTKVGIEAWVQLEALPPVLPVARALSMEWKTHFKYVLLFVDGASSPTVVGEATAVMEAAYPSYKGFCVNVLVVVSAADEGEAASVSQALEYFGVSREEVTTDAVVVRGFDLADSSKYLPKKRQIAPGQPITTALLLQFAKDLISGHLKPTLKSQPGGSGDDDGVMVVVGETFDALVLSRDEHVAVLLEVYAPWCGHCKKLAPDLSAVAHHYVAEEEVVIAKLDGTLNEVLGLNVGEDAPVKGYPTLRYYPTGGDLRESHAGKARDPRGVEFTGGMTREGMIAYIEDQEAQQAHMGHHPHHGYGGEEEEL